MSRLNLVLSGCCLGLFVLASQSTSVTLAADHTKDSLEEIRKAVAEGKAVLVDVREESECRRGYIEGAKMIPVSKIRSEASDEKLQEWFPSDKVVYLYCAGGYRCLDVAEMFEEKKLDLRPLKPGYDSLVKAGFKKAVPKQ